MKRSKKRSAGTKRRSNGLDKVEVESNNATERKEWYYIKCYDERNECDVTEIKNETTNEIIIPPIKIELKPMPIRYKKIDESFCMLLNDIRPMEVRDLIGNGENAPLWRNFLDLQSMFNIVLTRNFISEVCNGLSAHNEFSHDGIVYKDIRFSAEDDDCKAEVVSFCLSPESGQTSRREFRSIGECVRELGRGSYGRFFSYDFLHVQSTLYSHQHSTLLFLC
mmetsp:Transcript_19101/g.39379  ORF Transcript_19101/g.39379 Transcript_19101/m.39379 type:complete len:222 (+) Transcript_19101:458-1123(+)